MLAQLSAFGKNTEAIWAFAAGVLVVVFATALVVMAIEFIKTLIK